MDFIEQLVKYENKDTILVLVDWFTKYDHFIPLYCCFTAQEVAHLYMEYHKS